MIAAHIRTFVTIGIATSALLSNSVVSAQVPRLFEDDHFGGDSRVVDRPLDATALGSLDREISSVEVPNGWVLVVFSEANFRGERLVIPGIGRVADLASPIQNVSPGGWGDRIRSVAAFQNNRLTAPRHFENDEAGVNRNKPWRKEFYSLDNDGGMIVQAPRLDGRTVSFVDAISYLPNGDDDFSFSISPMETAHVQNDSSYAASAWNGNGGSRLAFGLTTWTLPQDATVQREQIVLQSPEGRMKVDFAFDEPTGWPRRRSSMIVIEVLEYDAGGDDDVSFAAREWSAAASPSGLGLTAIMDYGNAKSRIVLRGTLITWIHRAGTDAVTARPQGQEHSSWTLLARQGEDRMLPRDPDVGYVVTPIAVLGNSSQYDPARLSSIGSTYDAPPMPRPADKDIHDDFDFLTSLTAKEMRLRVTGADAGVAVVVQVSQPRF